jgi:metal-responsive CopG/Arc/MetJ family transcriptional regulator
MEKKKLKEVSIPTSLYEKIEEMIKGSGIDSVSSYVIKVLEESLSKGERTTESLSKEDEEKVKERLRALGYLD